MRHNTPAFQTEDPRLRAALLAAQQAFASANARQAPDGWEDPEDQDPDLAEAEGAPGALGSLSDLDYEDPDQDLERVMLVGVSLKSAAPAAAAAARRRRGDRAGSHDEADGGAGGGREGGSVYSIEESLDELGRLAETAGLKVGLAGWLSVGRLSAWYWLGAVKCASAGLKFLATKPTDQHATGFPPLPPRSSARPTRPSSPPATRPTSAAARWPRWRGRWRVSGRWRAVIERRRRDMWAGRRPGDEQGVGGSGLN
jgi:hypothetical protein